MKLDYALVQVKRKERNNVVQLNERILPTCTDQTLLKINWDVKFKSTLNFQFFSFTLLALWNLPNWEIVLNWKFATLEEVLMVYCYDLV